MRRVNAAVPLRRGGGAELDASVTIRDRADMGLEDRDWAKLDEPKHDSLLLESSYARRRSRTTRAFAIAMLIVLVLITLASLVRL
jgi:hypothetical protein